MARNIEYYCVMALIELENSAWSHLHLLNLGTSGSAVVGFVTSSKLIMYNDISSTSERIGAITSEQRNFCPVHNENTSGRTLNYPPAEHIFDLEQPLAIPTIFPIIQYFEMFFEAFRQSLFD